MSGMGALEDEEETFGAKDAFNSDTFGDGAEWNADAGLAFEAERRAAMGGGAALEAAGGGGGGGLGGLQAQQAAMQQKHAQMAAQMEAERAAFQAQALQQHALNTVTGDGQFASHGQFSKLTLLLLPLLLLVVVVVLLEEELRLEEELLVVLVLVLVLVLLLLTPARPHPQRTARCLVRRRPPSPPRPADRRCRR